MGLLCPDNFCILFSRERLEVGCCQLAQLEHTIKQCQASAHAEAKSRGWLWHLRTVWSCSTYPLPSPSPNSSGTCGGNAWGDKNLPPFFPQWCCFVSELKEKTATCGHRMSEFLLRIGSWRCFLSQVRVCGLMRLVWPADGCWAKSQTFLLGAWSVNSCIGKIHVRYFLCWYFRSDQWEKEYFVRRGGRQEWKESSWAHTELPVTSVGSKDWTTAAGLRVLCCQLYRAYERLWNGERNGLMLIFLKNQKTKPSLLQVCLSWASFQRKGIFVLC